MSSATQLPFDPEKPLAEWTDAEKRALLDSVEEMDIDFAESLRRFREQHAKPVAERRQEDSE